GGQSGRLAAASVLHPGDRLDVDFALTKAGPLRIAADGVEASGGAIAGALGLPANQPFRLDVKADGTASRGRFNAVARTGALTPLFAQGAWAPEGGQAGGRVQLDASTLTAAVGQRVGREVIFGLAGRKAGEGVYALDLTLRSEALTIHGWGPGDLGKRKLTRVQLDARAPSLTRILGAGPQIGAAQVKGAVTADQGDWRFEGSGAVADLVLGSGYRLRGVSGPFTLAREKGAVSLDARLVGAGGQGQGVVATLLGAAPGVQLDGQRLANGQLLVRRIDLTGRGLKITASGGRNLLGGVNLKGQAQVSNLAEARLGAQGGATIDLQASQARTGAPWTLGLDARGQRFAVGMAELDRLLGPQPRLQAQASFAEGRLAVSKATLNGAALDATAAGALERDQRLAFKADWNATGPFRAGPVEITGKARGTGAVTGPAASPRIDLTADIEQIDVPRLPLKNAKLALVFQRQADGSSGTVSLTAASEYGPARAASDFRFPRGGVDLTGLSVDAGGIKAQGSLSLRRSTPSAADLTLDIGRGAFLEAGRIAGTARITDAPGGPRAVLNLTADNARVTGAAVAIRSAKLTADGPLDRLPYAAEARGASERGAWTLNGEGVLDEQEVGYLLTFDGRGAVGGQELRTTEAASFRFGGPDKSARLRLAGANDARLDLDALLRGETSNVQARVANLGLTLFNADLDGRVDATLSLRGEGSRLDGVVDAQLLDARGRGTPPVEGVDGTFKGRLADDTLTIDVATTNEQGLRANANLVLPAEASAKPFRVAIARQRPMRGRFFAEGEVKPLWELFVGGERSLAGFVHTEGVISGSLADPRASGQITVERGRFDEGASGLSLRDVALKASFTEDVVNVTEARGVDGHGGTVNGQGQMSLERDGVSSFRLNLSRFRLIDNEMATASASGQATIRRASDGKATIAGDLAIDEAEVAADPPTPTGVVAMDVREINRPEDLVSSVPPRVVRRGDGWALDVKLRAPRRIFLRGRGLDVELSLDAHVGGTTTRPDLTGTARVVRGDYEFAGKRFEFDDRSVVYLSTRPANIRLQLDAVREDPSLTVTVRIRGTAERPEITLVSSPSLPNDEVLAKVLFERSASQLSAVEAAQLASALSALSGGGGLDVIGNLRSFAGLDRLAFGGDDQSGVTVSGGKYLTDDVYLELTGGGREGPSAQVEWRIRKNLSILSRIAGQAGNRLAVRWRKDY
ncbi:MAG: autotransporter, partial [Phenylobacterium zucineum]